MTRHMNAVRIPVLVTVFLLLFSALPCYASVLPNKQPSALSLENFSEDNANSPLRNIELSGNMTVVGNVSLPSWPSDSIYSVDAHVLSRTINPGETAEIEIYLSGYGFPQKNKLGINWSSSDLLDEKDPGNVTIYIVTYYPNTNTVLQNATSYSISHTPSYFFSLDPGFFATSVNIFPIWSAYGFRPVLGEVMLNGQPPLSLRLHTSKSAPAGDYEVRFTFTYGNETSLRQDSTTVEFHVKSSWQQWEPRLAISGIIIAFIALLITAAGTIWQMVRWHRGQ